MKAHELVLKLTEYFSGKYNAERIDQMERFAKGINEEDLESVYRNILENREGAGTIGIVDIRKACIALGVGYTETHFIPTQDWTCDCCGEQFKYHPCPTTDDKIDKNVFDVCPNCGLQVIWTLDARRERARYGKAEWYDRLLESCRKWGRGTAPTDMKQGQLSITRGGVFWSRIKAEDERRAEKHEESAVKMTTIDKRVAFLAAEKSAREIKKPVEVLQEEYAEADGMPLF